MNNHSAFVEFRKHRILNNCTEKEQLTAIREDPFNIYYIINPSEKVQLTAVKKKARTIQFIDNPTESVQTAAVNKATYTLSYIQNPCESIQLSSVRKCSYALGYINNPKDVVKLEAVKNYGFSIKFLDDPSEELQLLAVSNYNTALRYIKNPSEKVISESIKHDAESIFELERLNTDIIEKYRNNLTDKLNDYITTNNSYYGLYKARSLFHNLRLFGIEWLDFVLIESSLNFNSLGSNNENELNIISVRDHPYLFKMMISPTEKVKMATIKSYDKMIQYIENPSLKIQMEAVKYNRNLIQYIKNPYEEVLEYVFGNEYEEDDE